MDSKIKKVKMALLILLGVMIGHLGLLSVYAYQETTGSWTASEKRQVISLLESIKSNTEK